MFQDKLNNALAVGDQVAFVRGGNPAVEIGIIEAFTPKKVRIVRNNGYTSLKDPTDIVKVEIPNV